MRNMVVSLRGRPSFCASNPAELTSQAIMFCVPWASRKKVVTVGKHPRLCPHACSARTRLRSSYWHHSRPRPRVHRLALVAIQVSVIYHSQGPALRTPRPYNAIEARFNRVARTIRGMVMPIRVHPRLSIHNTTKLARRASVLGVAWAALGMVVTIRNNPRLRHRNPAMFAVEALVLRVERTIKSMVIPSRRNPGHGRHDVAVRALDALSLRVPRTIRSMVVAVRSHPRLISYDAAILAVDAPRAISGEVAPTRSHPSSRLILDETMLAFESLLWQRKHPINCYKGRRGKMERDWAIAPGG